jgi:hypothetical protein
VKPFPFPQDLLLFWEVLAACGTTVSDFVEMEGRLWTHMAISPF